jgi:hypothetical protein
METQPNAIGFVAESIRMHSLETLTLNKKNTISTCCEEEDIELTVKRDCWMQISVVEQFQHSPTFEFFPLHYGILSCVLELPQVGFS